VGSFTPVFLPDADALRAAGEALAPRLFSGAVLCLTGPLGAGKTTFVQGLARGLGVRGPVTSPTYAIVAAYPEASLPLHHVDLYRVEGAAELRALGLEEELGVEGVWAVEWAERFPALAPADHLEVRLEHAGDGRELALRATGPRHSALVVGR